MAASTLLTDSLAAVGRFRPSLGSRQSICTPVSSSIAMSAKVGHPGRLPTLPQIGGAGA